MSCQHCAGRIKKALDAANISGYEITLSTKEVQIDEAEAVKLLTVLESAGYPAE